MMNCSKLKILELSDVHLGHPNTPTSHILKNLYKIFKDTTHIASFDMIIIAGDFWDRLLTMTDPNVFSIHAFLVYLVRLCSRHKIVLRVLKGTPLHDWEQSKLFTEVVDACQLPIDFYYADTIAIESHEGFGINILYIPDEASATCDDTWVKVQTLMGQKGLKKVDFAIMHGAMTYQYPEHVHADTHVPSRYIAIVEYAIFIGHVHQHSIFDIIITAGSTDRLTHGDEIAKGHVECVFYKNGEREINFVQNEDAFIYKTFDCAGMSMEDSYRMIDHYIERNPKNIHIKVTAGTLDPIFKELQHLKKQYPSIKWTFKPIKEAGKDTTVKAQLPTIRKISLNTNTLADALIERIAAKHPHINVDECREILKETA